MKELTNVEPPETYPLLCMDCANNLIMDQRLLVKRDEYDRLKKIDKNIRDQIKAVNEKIISKDIKYDRFIQLTFFAKALEEILK